MFRRFQSLCWLMHFHSERGQIYVARQRYDAIGSRSNRVLSFEKGEELEVLTSSVTSEWWEVGMIYDQLQTVGILPLFFPARPSHCAQAIEGRFLPVS